MMLQPTTAPMTPMPIVSRWQYRRLVNEAKDAYVEWRQRCDEVWVAYSYWETARTGTVEPCHAAYAAALRREEQASQSYATLVHRVTDLQAADPQRVQPDLSGRGATAAPPA